MGDILNYLGSLYTGFWHPFGEECFHTSFKFDSDYIVLSFKSSIKIKKKKSYEIFPLANLYSYICEIREVTQIQSVSKNF